MSVLFLTAVRISPAKSNLTTAKVIQLESSKIFKPKAYRTAATILYGDSRPYKKYRVAETLAQIAVATVVGAAGTLASNPYAQDANLGVTPAGSSQAAASAVSTYLTVVSGGAASTNSVKLPAAVGFYSASTPNARVIINTSGQSISIFPAASEYINKSGATAGAGASNVAVTLAAGGRLHFVAAATDNWRVATETGE